MKQVKLTKALAGEGLAEGDVLSVDEFSAAALIKRGDAEEYVAEEAPADAAAPAEEATYGGQPAATIDDIVDPDVARNKRVMTATVVGGPATGGTVRRSPDANPADEPTVEDDTAVQSPTVKAANAKRAKGASTNPELAAPAANAAGGDAGGGDGS